MDWVLDWAPLWLSVLVIAIVALVWYDEAQWAEFSKQHDCKIVEKTTAVSAMAFGADGKMAVVTIPGKTSYRCDDGITYTR